MVGKGDVWSHTHAVVTTVAGAGLQERARIARELHDGVSQSLYANTPGAARTRVLLQQDKRNDVQGKQALMMIAREALHNIVKHAGARRGDITVAREAGVCTY
jgi:signal transduction histidine kinase